MSEKFFRRIGFGSLICALLSLCACGGASGSPSHNPGTPAQPQIPVFIASPTSVNGGQTTTITWATTNATSVTITPPVPQTDDTDSLPTSGSSVVPVMSTTTFTINAGGPGGTAAHK